MVLLVLALGVVVVALGVVVLLLGVNLGSTGGMFAGCCCCACWRGGSLGEGLSDGPRGDSGTAASSDGAGGPAFIARLAPDRSPTFSAGEGPSS